MAMLSVVPTQVQSPRLSPSRRRQIIWLLRLLLVASTLGLWQWSTAGSAYLVMVFSSPSLVFARLAAWLADPSWWRHLGVTLQGAALGYALGVAVALALVAVVTPSRLMTRFLAPFIAVLNSLPKVALAPLFIFWFGIALQSKVYFVASIICFIIFYGVHTGLRTIDPVLRDNIRLLGATKYDLLVHLYLPATLTWIISSLRLSLTFALLAAVVSEYLGSIRGIGFLIANAQLTLRSDVLIAGIIVIAAVSVTLDKGLIVIEKRMSSWRAF